MANNKKISELAAAPSAANADILPIVDVESGVTKKITKENFLEEVVTDLENHTNDTEDPHHTLDKFRENIEPAEEVDGIRTTFTISENIAQDTLKVFADGVRLRQGAGKDFTVAYGSGIATISFVVPPMQWVMCDYRLA
ncbi:MAG: hypothetical protein WC763_04805 [Candidatus Paceibacterota bacterium]|jgi:hypothetical protein